MKRKQILYGISILWLALLLQTSFAHDELSALSLNKPANLRTVIAWGDNAIRTIYTYDYVNFRWQHTKAAAYFTQAGWKSYSNALRNSNVLATVKKKQWVASITIAPNPKVKFQGVVNGRYTWDIHYSVITRYQNINEKQVMPLDIVVTIVRTDDSEGYQGLGITVLKATKVEEA